MSNLKHYQCIKQVHAEPMKYGEFVMKYRDGHGPTSMSIMSHGYHIISRYGDDDEFHQWLPQHVFEGDYVPIDNRHTLLTPDELQMLKSLHL